MLIITVLQLIVFFAVLLFGGEFSYLRKYAYNDLIEKNFNRKTIVENLMNSKTETVCNAAEEINRYVDGLLEEQGLSAEDIRSSRELNKQIISDSAGLLISLLRQSGVNDVFLFLDSGELYSSGDVQRISGIYIRDADPAQNDASGNRDLFLEAGFSSIGDEYGITLDFEWSVALEITDREDENYDFYFTTVDTAKNAGNAELFELGYWSGFSRISRSAGKSIKYTLPLISGDGTVYGVVGIGLMEKQIQDVLPSSGFFNGKACYILGVDTDASGRYTPIMHTGPIYERVVDSNTVFSEDNRIEGDIYDFNKDGELDTVGNIRQLDLYNSTSPYKNQKWAFIAVGEKEGILEIYNVLLKMLLISSVVSIGISLIGAVIINRITSVPVENMITTLKSSYDSSDIVEFKSSRIREIDLLGDAIRELQINVRENASRVSRIIGMVGVQIGVFMYNFNDNTVFVSGSLIKLLHFEGLSPDEDAVLSFEGFSRQLGKTDRNNFVCSDEIFSYGSGVNAEKREIEITCPADDGRSDVWLKFSLTRDRTSVIGIAQDVTKDVLEKKRIEYERDYDVTTGLLNRRAYLARLDRLFARPERLKTGAFIMIDLDDLKYVNDTYGHDFGDDYIKAAANVFKSFMDYDGLVSRLSGDEFNIFLSGFESKEEIRPIIEEIQYKLSESGCILSDGTKYRIRASGGVAWFPDDSDSYELLMKYADFAMYTIKHTTKGSIAEFDMTAYRKDSILMTGIEEMNRLIDERSVRFAFQSIVSAKTGDVFGYEILMRPQSEILKTPLDFIRLAKTGAKLYEIEKLTWTAGLENVREKIKNGGISPDTHIFINSLSNCMITADDVAYIEREFYDILPNIVLEVLEGEKENEIFTGEKLKLTNRWHAKIALDDFGSGYNSEFLLIKLSPDIIKIDRSIISGCDRDIGRMNIISSLIKMAKSRNVTVLAEGVETSGELKTVIECGVDLIQGYYITHPLLDPVLPSESVREEIRRFSGI